MLKVMELFGGIGACTQAMKRIGIEFKVVDYVEIDKYAVKSYNAINSTNYEPQDITKWDKDIKADFIMSGSPCQDFSVAGLGKGGDEGSGTRSSLMYENVRIIDKVRPKYVLWENVKNVLSKKHRHNFDNYLSKMEELGYHNYYQVLNAKDYGVPQNRERIFVLSCLEDIDYKFPEKQELTIRLKDILEDEVDEKYYISSDKVEKLVKQIVEKQGDKGLGALLSNCILDDTNSEQLGNCRLYKDNAPSLRSQRQGQKVVEIQQIGNINPSGHGQNGSVVSDQGLARTVTVEKGEGQKIFSVKVASERFGGGKVKEDVAWCLQSREYKDPQQILSVSPILTPDRLEKRQNGRRCKEDGEPMFTLTGQDRHGVVLMLSENDYFLVQIRKLVPLECWRLMGFTDDVFKLAEEVNSNSQLYKQAGNSIVVDVLVQILGQMQLGEV